MIDSLTSTTYTVICDLCGDRNAMKVQGFTSVERAYGDAFAKGWILADAQHRDLCPRCIPTTETCS
jgi:hypothetical protein